MKPKLEPNTSTPPLLRRVAEQGLCKPRQSFTLSQWLDSFIRSHEKKVSSHCLSNLNQAERLLKEHFSEDIAIKSITPEAAVGFREWLQKQDYSQATIAGHIRKAKQFFSAAVKVGAIASNPFADVVAGTQVNSERSVYVSAADIEQAIAMAPDAQWRLIIALSRYGGLRCPSETLALRWSDIDFQQNLITVNCTKTAKQGKSKRQVPIFPELRPYLEDAFEPENEFCITRYRDTNSNLRTQFLRILAKATVSPWPRLFHNLRGSLETDFMNRYSAHVVVSGSGNSERVAIAAYLKVSPEHIAKAAAEGVGQQAGTYLSETTSKDGNQRNQISPIPEENENARFRDTALAPRADSQRNFFSYAKMRTYSTF